MRYILILSVILQATIQMAKMHTITIFEDGSYGMGYYPYAVEGCLPFSLCGDPSITIHDDRLDLTIGG